MSAPTDDPSTIAHSGPWPWAAAGGGTNEEGHPAAGSADERSAELPPVDMDEIVERVVDRIEQRVVDELERRGRRHNSGAF